MKYEHRLVWELYHGPIPDGMHIDHINHIRDDNRLCNLRLASRSENCCNQLLLTRNTSGVKGVTVDQGKYYYAQVVLNGEKFQKTFPLTEEGLADATAWVQAKRVELHQEFVHHG
jgi:hypothetical protein